MLFIQNLSYWATFLPKILGRTLNWDVSMSFSFPWTYRCDYMFIYLANLFKISKWASFFLFSFPFPTFLLKFWAFLIGYCCNCKPLTRAMQWIEFRICMDLQLYSFHEILFFFPSSGSVVQRMDCSCRRPELIAQHLKIQIRRMQSVLFLKSMGTVLVCTTPTFPPTVSHNLKKKEEKITLFFIMR